MDELSDLANRFKSKLNLHPGGERQQQWQQSPGPQQPPPMPMPYQQPPSYQQQPVYYNAGYSEQYPQSPSAGGPPPVPPRPQAQSPPALAPRPPVAPRPDASTRPLALTRTSPALPAHSPKHKTAGARYVPGTYPTPELPTYPIQQSRTLQPSSVDEYNSVTIQKALDDMGPSGIVYLPAGSTWRIEATIKMQDFQELATVGYPTSSAEMAILDAQEDCHGHIIHAFDRSGIRIRNLILEGNKEKYGWDEKGGCMIQLGGGKAHNQVLDRCIIRNPRHWSCIQAFEGAHNVRITNNAIGPAGVGADIHGGKWADGISYAASDGLVAGNLVIDTTDGGIVLFNAPGTLVTSNTVVTRTRLGLGAINMVDFIVYDGNYTYTRVTHNTIVTAGSLLKIGIGQGTSVWWQQNEKRQISHSGTVSHNLITRDTSLITHVALSSSSFPPGDIKPGSGTIGYGFPVGSDITDWTCIDNVSEDDVRYEGDISGTLPAFLNAAPGPFIHDRYGNKEGDEVDMSKLRLQPEFVQGKVWGLLDIKEGPSKVLAYDGGGLRLRRGEKLRLHGAFVVLREDAELCIYQDDGHLLWEAGIAHRLGHGPHLEHATLHFTSSGKLIIASGDSLLLDLTPHIAAHLPPSPNNRPNSPRLTLSSEKPYLRIASSTGNVLFGSSYAVGRFSEFRVGKYVARPTPYSPDDGGDGNGETGTLVWTFSPQRQFVVFYVHRDVELPQRVDWPVDPSIARVVASVGDGKTEGVDDPEAKMGLQGDGHLVIYDGNGAGVWGSGTCGDRGAFKMLFGLGTPEEPYLELVNEKGERLWST